MESPAQLRAICHAGKEKQRGWYVVHRRISIYLTWLFLHTKVTANQVSILMMVVGFVGAVLLSFEKLPWNVVGFCLLYLAFLLDKVDGEIARYRRLESVQGILLDRLYHSLVEPSIIIAAAYHAHQVTSSIRVLFAGLVTIILANIVEGNQHLSAYILAKHVRQVGKPPDSQRREESPGLRLALTVLRPLKGFARLVVVLPLLAVAYGVEWATGWRSIEYYFYTSAAALSVYLVFQCYYYFVFRLDEEIALIRENFTSVWKEEYESSGRWGDQTNEKEQSEATGSSHFLRR